jgi:hypothetical protein
MHTYAGLTLLQDSYMLFLLLEKCLSLRNSFWSPLFFSIFLKFWKAAIKQILSLSVSLLLCLSAGRPTQNAQRWQNLLGCALNLALCVGLVNLWEYIRTEWGSNLSFFPVGSFHSRTSGGWVGPEGFWNLPRLGFFFFLGWWFRPNGAEDVRFPLARSFSGSLAGYPTPAPTNACLPDVSYLSLPLWWQNLVSQRQTTESGLLHYLSIRSEFRWSKGVGEIS